VEGKSNTSNVLPEELSEKIQLRLNKALIENKLYLHQDLCMHQLAKEINTNTSYLSRTIKRTYNTNFTALLNALRINEAKALLADPKYGSYTINAISQECGYKNKSTFYKAFKKITGLEPYKYRKQMKQYN